MDYNYDFGRLNESGNIEYAPLPLPINGNTWTNSPAIHLEAGYYPIKNTEPPQKEGYFYTSYYVLENNEIVQKWEEHEQPPEPEPADDPYYLLDIISGDVVPGEEQENTPTAEANEGEAVEE